MKKIIYFNLATLFIILININNLFPQFIEPVGGNNYYIWFPNNIVTINWNNSTFKNDSSQLTLSLWNGDSGLIYIITSNVPSNRTNFAWEIPNNFPLGDKFRLRISNGKTIICNDNYITISNSIPLFKRNIDNLSFENIVVIYPNPSKQFICLKSTINMKGNLQIYDDKGILVRNLSNIEFNHEYFIDVKDFNTGWYNIIMKNEYYIINKRFLVVH